MRRLFAIAAIVSAGSASSGIAVAALGAGVRAETHAFAQVDAWTFTLTPRVESRGETRVEYRVRARWC